MTIAPGANLLGVKAEILVGLLTAYSIYTRFGYELRLIGHTNGEGIDINPPPDGQRPIMIQILREALGPQFTITERLASWHFEWQPK